MHKSILLVFSSFKFIFFHCLFENLCQKTKMTVILAKSGLPFSPIIKPGASSAHSKSVYTLERGTQGLQGLDTLFG